MRSFAPVSGVAPGTGLSTNNADERRSLLAKFQGIRSEYPSESCVHTLFELQTERTPDRIALLFGNQALTYAELNSRANRLAHHLLRIGVGPETLVGLAMHRSLDQIISILAILKSGGAYVPIDPDYPAQRLALMLEETSIGVLVTETGFLHKLPANLPLKVVSVGAEEASRGDSDNPMCRTNARNLAYVMFTSGSTGKPKGVMVEHRSIVRLVKGTDYADFSANNVFLQFAPVTFDASTFEIWGALLNGAQLAIMPDGVTSLEELGRAIRRYKATTLWLTAGLFHLFVDERIEDLRPLRQILAGGDVLSVPHVRKVLTSLDCQLINGYGPTENTTFTCCYSIQRESRFDSSVPIGKPIANTQVFILDKSLNPVPIGEPGELYIGGDGLARGYFNDGELTAERFLDSPFPDLCPRLYKTGDRGRFLADGTVEFLGRIDNQIKIRGFRIEPEEIEIALAGYSGIRQAVVTSSAAEKADKQLLAFVVYEPGQPQEICKLRDYLKVRLPEFMIPALIFAVDAIPLTPNGKVDRQALRSTTPQRKEGCAFVRAESETERTIEGVFRGVLQLEELSVEDSFFDLGASSLQLVSAHSRLQALFGTELKLITLFRYPTVSSLAKHLSGHAGKSLSAVSRVLDSAARQREAQARQKQIHRGVR